MTTREQFEMWAEKMGMDLSTAFFIENAAYLDDDTDLAYRSWQASRAAALEEAAKECVKLADEAREDMALEIDYRFGVYAKKYDKAACYIRALKDAP